MAGVLDEINWLRLGSLLRRDPEIAGYQQGGLLETPTGRPQYGQPAPNAMRPNALQALGAIPLPGVSDVAGLLGDALMFRDNPEARSPQNYLMSGMGLLPFVPALGTVRSLGLVPAFRHKGTKDVISGGTLHALLTPQLSAKQWAGADIEAGFVDAAGKFFNRDEAMTLVEKHAPKAKQLNARAMLEPGMNPHLAGTLTSEGLADVLRAESYTPGPLARQATGAAPYGEYRAYRNDKLREIAERKLREQAMLSWGGQ